MHDLKTQLTEYLDHFVERVDVDEIFMERVGTPPVRPLRPRRPQQQRRHWNGWAVAVVAFVAVVLAGVVVGLLTGDASVPVVDTPPSTVAPPATTVPPTTAAEDTEAAPASTVVEVPDTGIGPVLVWEEIEGITVLDDGWGEVRFTGEEYVALQGTYDGSNGTVVVSSSPDGTTWTETTYALPSDYAGNRERWAVNAGRVVIAYTLGGGVNTSGPDTHRLAVIDRVSGEVTSYDMPMSGQPEVAVAPDGGLVVGTNDRLTRYSIDGTEWDPVIVEGGEGLWGDCAHRNGALTCVGQSQQQLYRSQDGHQWRRVELPETQWGAWFASWQDGLVTSADASTIVHVTEAGERPLPFPEFELGIGHLSAGDLGIIAVEQGGRMLFSPDGEAWSLTEQPDGAGATFQLLTGTAIGPDAAVIFVRQDSGNGFLRGTPGDG